MTCTYVCIACRATCITCNAQVIRPVRPCSHVEATSSVIVPMDTHIRRTHVHTCAYKREHVSSIFNVHVHVRSSTCNNAFLHYVWARHHVWAARRRRSTRSTCRPHYSTMNEADTSTADTCPRDDPYIAIQQTAGHPRTSHPTRTYSR